MKRNKLLRVFSIVFLAVITCLFTVACAGQNSSPQGGSDQGSGSGSEQASTADAPADSDLEHAGEVMILFTSDVHCGVAQGFGYAGLQQIRETLEAQGYTTILVDDGDSIQGDAIGTLSRGEAIIDLMNQLHYDVAIPGNHEFDYGMDQFLSLVEKADFPYISCNFNKEGELVLSPYVIKEVAGMKIGFVGVTTPGTRTSSTPSYFQNEEGEFIYGFLEDETGQELWQAVQDAVDAARADGAEYVYVMGHLGMFGELEPWLYADVIENTNGIDVFLDGHSHDTDQVVVKNKDGEDVPRSAVGTKLNCIGYSHIVPGEGIVETGIWSWPNSESAPELLNIQNIMSQAVNAAMVNLSATLDEVIANSAVDLTIYDPTEVDSSGNPIRMVRRAETNLGDFCADAMRAQGKADIAITNGGGVRTNLAAGDVTYGNIIAVFPFGNHLCVIEATGQQILDALEWGASSAPAEFGGFLQVSGMSYEINLSIESSCTSDENGMFTGVAGERRVQNVLVGGEPIDPEKTYTVAGFDYTLLSNGDGHTAFDGCTLLQDRVKIDNQVLIDYIVEDLGGEIGSEYADPLGQDRITIVE